MCVLPKQTMRGHVLSGILTREYIGNLGLHYFSIAYHTTMIKNLSRNIDSCSQNSAWFLRRSHFKIGCCFCRHGACYPHEQKPSNPSTSKQFYVPSCTIKNRVAQSTPSIHIRNAYVEAVYPATTLRNARAFHSAGTSNCPDISSRLRIHNHSFGTRKQDRSKRRWMLRTSLDSRGIRCQAGRGEGGVFSRAADAAKEAVDSGIAHDLENSASRASIVASLSQDPLNQIADGALQRC